MLATMDSIDGRYMLFDIPLEPANYPPLAERWLLDIENGAQTLLEAQVVDCGGCDSRYGAQWSPDGRFVLFAESGGTGRVFLVDLQGRTTTVVGNGNDRSTHLTILTRISGCRGTSRKPGS